MYGWCVAKLTCGDQKGREAEAEVQPMQHDASTRQSVGGEGERAVGLECEAARAAAFSPINSAGRDEGEVRKTLRPPRLHSSAA